MGEWWQNLSGVNQAFYIAATFFSVFFLWQLIAALVGLGGGEADMDADVDAADDGTYEDFEHGAATDASASVAAFKLVSVRSILAFCTLFSWAGALYLNRGHALQGALIYALLWGAAAMGVVALIFHLMRRMTEAGTPQLATCVGQSGTVYLDIPDGGRGEVRVPVSGIMTHVKARASNGKTLKMGTSVRVVRVLDAATIEVASSGADASIPKQ